MHNRQLPDVAEAKKFVIPQQQVFTRLDYLLFTILTVGGLIAAINFLIPWFSLEDRINNPTFFWLLTFVFFSKLFISQLRWGLLPFMKKPKSMPARSDWKVGLATTFVPDVESIEMLEITLRAMVEVDYPHDTWVLDEGNDPAVRELCKKLGVLHFSRKSILKYQTEDGTFQARTKHGNYNSWLKEIGYQKYEIISAFDPDHIPLPNFVSEVLGYFDSPDIGYVQAAQIYYNQKASFIARGAAEETYSYYSTTQMFCNAMEYPIVTGCHNTHRVSALREVGGFAVHDADDLLITLLYRVAGWKGVYIPKIIARGLTPVDWEGYLNQQLRWARSVLDIKFRIHPKLLGKLHIKEKITSFFHGFYYLQGITTLIILFLLGYMLVTGLIPNAVTYLLSLNFFMLFAVMLLCDIYHQRFYIDRKNEWGFHWRAGLLRLAKYPYLIMALYQVIRNRRFEYVVTSKIKSKKVNFKLLLPHLIVSILIGSAWISGVYINGSLSPLLHVVAGLTLVGTFILIGTGFMKFPAPFDPNLYSPIFDKYRQKSG
jgi:cellulose synthase (UDP-forming)